MKKIKRITALLISFTMCLSLLSVGVVAKAKSHDDSISSAKEISEYHEIDKPQKATRDCDNNSRDGNTNENESDSCKTTDAHSSAIGNESSGLSVKSESDENCHQEDTEIQLQASRYQCGDNATWDLDEDGTMTITGTGKLYDYSRWDKKSIKKLIIEEGITYIGRNTFSYCPNLISIIFAKSVSNISDEAFNGCSSLETVTIPEAITTVDGFRDCKKLKEVVITGKPSYIGNNAFRDCTSLEKINLPDSILSIGESAFSGCTSLETIDLPKNLERIYYRGFYGCTHLKSIVIPDNTLIVFDAFSCCESLTSVVLPANLKTIKDGTFNNCTSLRNIEIPEGVTEIEKNAFDSCSSLEEITIPDQVTSIGQAAFSGCTGLKRVIFGSGLNSLDKSVFVRCTSLNRIEFTGNAPYFDRICFNGVTANAYYPADNETWTTDIMQDYGGHIDWGPIKDGILFNEEEIKTQTNEKTAIDGSIIASKAPSSSDIEWSIKRKEVELKDTVDLDSCSILTIGEGEYCFSRMASFSEPGIYVVKAVFKGSSDTCKVIVKPGVIEDFIVNASDRGKIYLEWPEVKGIDGFQIQYSEDKSFKKYETKDVDIKSTEFDEMEGTRKYSWKYKNSDIPYVYVRISAYLKDGNHIIQGDWSEVDENTKAIFTYNAERDGWCIPNAYISFGDSSYRLTDRSYNACFSCIQLTEASYIGYHLINALNPNYNGSCHGMAVMSVGNYFGKVDLREVFGKEGLGLSEYGQTGMVFYLDNNRLTDYGDTSCFTIRDNYYAVSLVERCFWSQYSSQLFEVKKDWDNNDLINYLLDTEKPNPIVVSIEGLEKIGKDGKKYRDAHTIVIDPTEKPEKVSEGVYKINLYDPNVPSGGRRLPGKVYHGYSREAYLYVCTTGDQKWKYWCGMGETTEFLIENVQSDKGHHYIQYFDLSKLKKEFYTTQKYTAKSLVSATFSSNISSFTCRDDKGSLLTIKDGNITAREGDIDYDPIFSGDGHSAGKMVYFNSPDYSFSCDSGDVVFCNEQSSYRMTVGQAVSVNVSKSGIELSAENHDTDIQIEKLYSGDDHRINSAEFSLTIPENHKISLSDSKDNSVEIQGDYTGSVDVNFSDGDMNHKGQVMIDGKQSVTVNESTFEGTPTSDHTHIWKNASEDHGSSSESDYLITYTCSICGKTRVEIYPATESGVITCKDVVKSYSVKKQSFKLNAKTEDGAKLSYKSNNKKVKVDKKGKVTLPAKFSGTVKITITADATDQYAEATKTISVTVPTVPGVRKISSGKGQITVSWKKNATGKGYEIQYSTDKTFKKTVKTVKIKKMKTTKATIKKLNTGTRYYLRIRTVNGKHYSNWSAAKSVKTG